MAAIAFVISYIRYYFIEGDGDNRLESSKSVKVQFPDDENYDGIELIDDDVLHGEYEGEEEYCIRPGISGTLSMLASLAFVLDHPQQCGYSPDPSVEHWAKGVLARVEHFNAHQ